MGQSAASLLLRVANWSGDSRRGSVLLKYTGSSAAGQRRHERPVGLASQCMSAVATSAARRAPGCGGSWCTGVKPWHGLGPHSLGVGCFPSMRFWVRVVPSGRKGQRRAIGRKDVESGGRALVPSERGGRHPRRRPVRELPIGCLTLKGSSGVDDQFYARVLSEAWNVISAAQPATARGV
jgi:hypothetical protein